MGNFFHSVHFKIKGKEKYVKGFNAYMKKKDFVPCEDDEAEKTYIAAFSEGQDWVTLVDMESSDNSKTLFNVAKAISSSMKLPCITEEVIDSDVAILKLFDKTGENADTIVVGDGESYGIGKAGEPDPECWKPLLKNRSDIEKLIAFSNDSDVFVEDSLSKIAALFGMDMLTDQDELSARNDEMTVKLSFKKAAAKKPTLKSLVKQIYGEALEPLGFKIAKVRLPMFVRVINDEIIHIIGVDDMKSHLRVFGAIATVYRKELCLDGSFRQNEGWFKGLTDFYVNWHISDKPFEGECRSGFRYMDLEDGGFMPLSAAVKNALDATMTWIYPVLDNLKTLKDVEDYDNIIFNSDISIISLPLNKSLAASYTDTVIKYLFDDPLADLEQQYLATLKRIDEENVRYHRTQEEVFQRFERYEQRYNESRKTLQMFLEDEETRIQTLEELARRKEHNLEMLKKYNVY